VADHQFLVDVVQVAPADVPAYLEALAEMAVPVMSEAGATLETCRTTSGDLGLDVDVEVVWRVPDFGEWNRVRRDLVLDPRWHAWGDRAKALRRGGTRRFMRPVDLSRTG
jgi:hypothetical protein